MFDFFHPLIERLWSSSSFLEKGDAAAHYATNRGPVNHFLSSLDFSRKFFHSFSDTSCTREGRTTMISSSCNLHSRSHFSKFVIKYKPHLLMCKIMFMFKKKTSNYRTSTRINSLALQ